MNLSREREEFLAKIKFYLSRHLARNKLVVVMSDDEVILFTETSESLKYLVATNMKEEFAQILWSSS